MLLVRMIVLENTNITIAGATDLSTSEDVLARYRASGWHTVSCDGHDFADIRRAIDEALADPRPSLIDCHTIIGHGAPNKQGTATPHGAARGQAEGCDAVDRGMWVADPLGLPGDSTDTPPVGKGDGSQEKLRW